MWRRFGHAALDSLHAPNTTKAKTEAVLGGRRLENVPFTARREVRRRSQVAVEALKYLGFGSGRLWGLSPFGECSCRACRARAPHGAVALARIVG